MAAAVATPSPSNRRLTNNATPGRSPGRALLAAKTPERNAPTQSSVTAKYIINNETPFADDQELRDELERTVSDIDQAAVLLREARVERRRRHLAHQAELDDERARLETEIDRLAKLAIDRTKTLESERAEQEQATKAVSVLESRKRDMLASLQSLKGDVDEWNSRLETKQDANERERKLLQSQVSKNLDEVLFCQESLGLNIVSKSLDQLKFEFTLIDPSEYKRKFSLLLDISGDSYKVLTHSPMLDNIDSLLISLNRTRDFYGFLRSLRSSWCESVRKERS